MTELEEFRALCQDQKEEIEQLFLAYVEARDELVPLRKQCESQLAEIERLKSYLNKPVGTPLISSGGI